MLVLGSTVITLALLLRFGPALSQSRLGHPDNYQFVLDARRLILGGPAEMLPSPFVILSAALAVLSGVDPIHAVRFLGPMIGFLLPVAAAAYVYRATANGSAALLAMYALGTFTFITPHVGGVAWWEVITSTLNDSFTRQWNAGDWELGAFFGLCAALAWPSRASNRADLVNAGCAVVLVALTAPALLIVVVATAAARKVGPAFAAAVMASSWIGLSVIGAGSRGWAESALATLAVGLALGLGVSSHGLSLCAPTSIRARFRLATLVALVVAGVELAPTGPGGKYLEYEISARKTAEIAASFPRGQWMVVGPVEQLPVVYGLGWYLELSAFVNLYAETPGHERAELDFAIDDVFVFIEKQPFVVVTPAPAARFSTLADPTYLNYRSPAGRASLDTQPRKYAKG